MSPAAGPRLCVVVPTLDEEACLGALLARLCDAHAAADRADLVVVSDGGSLDRTVGIARSHGALLVTGAPGRGAQQRRGAEAAAAGDDDALLFLHADCVPLPGALAELRRALADP